jgi:replicative DNA helicase
MGGNMSKFYDEKTAEMVLINVFKFPQLLDQPDKFYLSSDDFYSKFHKTIFVSINNLFVQGLEHLTTLDIENYLHSKPDFKKIFDDGNGSQLLGNADTSADINSFQYYYERLKKLTLLRAFDHNGIDIEPEFKIIDDYDIEQIADSIDQRIERIKSDYLSKTWSISKHAGEGLEDLINSLKQQPEFGIPLYGKLINTITRGARLRKFYLRSAPTGLGKSRMMIADICNFSCDEIYDLNKRQWVQNGASQPSVFISTELGIDECQTMALAFLSGVKEDIILNGTYSTGEEERVLRAAQILSRSPIWIEHLPDFSIRDIENVIRRNRRENGVLYYGFDYIHSSLRILEEISQRTKGMKLREDNILFMLAIRLKDLCNELGIFIMSSTQLNADWESRETSNQNVLRGAKAIGDKIDVGYISLPVTEQDREALAPFVQASCLPMPNIVHHIYKNRRGKFKSVKLWCHGDLSICRVDPLFLTEDDYTTINIEDFEIVVKKE